MTKEFMSCKYCSKIIAERTVCRELEPDILDWKKSEHYYTSNICTSCAVQYLEEQLKFEKTRQDSLLKLCKERQKEKEKLCIQLEKYKRFFTKQQARINAFVQEV